MNDFGYDSNGVAAIRSSGRTYWINARSGVRFDSNITPVQVVGPGQVAVDADDLRIARNLASALGLAEYAAVVDRIDAALAAAEPAPDSGQGETVREWTGAMIDGAREAGKSAGETFADFAERIRVRDAETGDIPTAEPPKADAADTDAREYERTYDELVADISDRAAQRGRDDALAVVVKALRQVQSSESRDPVADRDLLDLARRIEREQGGDGR